ncbi:DNA-binding response regulator, OmpR family, contains REC and winged-helix (wHTH) domain [Marivirga sericea]|uniref:DNA-binding response regulator, OmpR family, contains REC and winged-helix (WHTH) domain n=1 Tax=Marivirga sericea TaxID=1028 RepID=A0A1X7JRU4_9BACT|nr:response regulator transcription factor [Marivirga sericea]SMG30732.1 DNA-binding response regulator, OmpR family, contains REC and winged-helix (wHTH) domain [Marivirga sericea]
MKKEYQLLLAEDEPSLGLILKESLESRGFKVDHCEDGEAAWNCYQGKDYDLLILDVMMPKLDGFSLAQKVRKVDGYIPIIFLTAKSTTNDVVEGFEKGGNDYIKKPFSIEELIVRVKALLEKKSNPIHQEWMTIGKYQFHPGKQILKIEEDETYLTSKESEVLKELMMHQNELTDRSTILEKLWGSADFFNARSMDVYISKLRKKLEKDPELQILNIRGYGYKLISS